MNKGFARFKKSIRIGALVRSSVFALAAGCIAGSLPILIPKLIGSDPDIRRALIAGGATALIAFAAFMLAVLPTDRRIAKRLDRKLSLNEKVQTMLEFRQVNTDMAVVQRETTDRILRETPLKKARSSHLWLNFVAPVIALALITTSLVIPAKADEEAPPPVDNTYHLSEWQKQALLNLIDDVEKSDMESAPKDATSQALRGLLSKLQTVKKESEMKEQVIETISVIYTLVNDHNTYDVISAQLVTSERSEISLLGECIKELGYSSVGDSLDLIRSGADGNSTQMKADAEARLKASGALSSDPLRSSIASLFTSLEQILAESLGEDELKEKLDTLFLSAEEEIGNALLAQLNNETVGADARSRLMAIFGISTQDLPSHLRPNQNSGSSGDGDYSDGKDDMPIGPGGLGSGEMVYGSDDMIYDPIRGEYVTYGEVIAQYYATISQLIVDGGVPYDIEELISDYFASLFDGSKKDNNG